MGLPLFCQAETLKTKQHVSQPWVNGDERRVQMIDKMSDERMTHVS